MTSNDLGATFAVRSCPGLDRSVVVLTATGDIDQVNDHDLRHHVDHATGLATDQDAVVVDLSGVTFLGGRALTGLAEQSRRHTRPLRLVLGARGVVRRALDALELTADVELHGDLAAAVNA